MTRYNIRQQPGSFLYLQVIDTQRSWRDDGYVVASYLTLTQAQQLAQRLNSGMETA